MSDNKYPYNFSKYKKVNREKLIDILMNLMNNQEYNKIVIIKYNRELERNNIRAWVTTQKHVDDNYIYIDYSKHFIIRMKTINKNKYNRNYFRKMIDNLIRIYDYK